MIKESPEEFPFSADLFEYIHFPAQDKSTLSDENLVELVDMIIDRFQQGRNIYIHCRGGHGRSGTVVSVLLGKLYGLSAFDALNLCAKYHECREQVKESAGVYSSPETSQQRNQVYRLLK